MAAARTGEGGEEEAEGGPISAHFNCRFRPHSRVHCARSTRMICVVNRAIYIVQFIYALRIIPTTIGSMHTYIQYIQSIQYIQYISSSAQVIRIEVSIVRQRARCEFSRNTRAVAVAVTVDVSVAVDVAVAVTMASILYTGYRSFLPVPEAHLIPGNLVFKCCV